jgi:hypothetical protein
MRKAPYLFTLQLILASAMHVWQPLIAQQTFQIGHGTLLTSSPGETPFGTSFHDNRNQILILASELHQTGAVSGQILSLGFEAYRAEILPMNNFTVSIRHTQVSAVTGTFEPAGSFAQVWQGNYVAQDGWNIFQFAQPFQWDGQSNILIQTCFDNNTFAANSSVFYHTTTYASQVFGYSYSQFSNPCSDQTAASTTTQRPNMRLTLLPNTINDAGIAQLDSPVAFCPGSHPLLITVRNYGRNQINSLTINWVFDGIPQTPVSFTGLLDTFGGQGPDHAQVLLGTRNFVAGQTHSLAAWTSSPNGQQDSFNYNDTLISLLKPSLQGTLTIGGSSPDYPTFSDAVQDINANGVCGSVVFEVRPGTYTEQVSIGNIPGASATNTITFRAENGDSSTVVLSFGASLFANNYVVQFEGTRHVQFDRLTFEATDPFNGIVFRFNGGIHDSISIRRCEIKSASGSTTSANMSAVYNNAATLRHFRFENNYVYSCSYGYFSTSGPDSFSVFKDNRIHPYYMGLRTSNSYSPLIKGNEIISNTGSIYNFFYGLYMSQTTGSPKIEANSINARTGAYGMYFSGFSSDSSNPGLIANNMVHVGGAGTGVACYFTGQSTYLNIYHNTFQSTAAGITSRGLWIAGSGTGLRLVNNIFSNEGGGHALYVSGPSLIAHSNFNCYYTTGNNFVYWGANASNLNALRTLNSMDQSSLVADPGYFDSKEDLHCTSGILNDKGTPLAEVPLDIDGDIRSLTTPDIGADEFEPLDHDVAVLYFDSPQVLGCDVNDSTVVTIAIANLGRLPQTGFEVSFRIYSIVVATETVTSTIQPGDTLLYTFSKMVDLSVPAIYPMNAWSSLVTDQNRRNDSVLFHPIFSDLSISSFPYIQHFDNNFGGIPQGWQNDPFDGSEDWRFYNSSSGQTPLPAGIPGDHTTGTGYFAWVDNSFPNSESSNLLTPCFNLQLLTKPYLEFYLWNGDNSGNIFLHLDVWYAGEWHLDIVPAMGFQSGSFWAYKLIDLGAFKNGPARIRFRAREVGTNNLSDLAIDDVKVFDLGPVNTGVVAINKPENGCNLTDFEPVEITVIQLGYDTLKPGTIIPVGFSVDGGQIHTEVLVLSKPLPQFDTVTYTFLGVANLSQSGTFAIRAWTSTPGDNDPTNDTLLKYVSNSLIHAYPYVQDFDAFKVAENATGFKDFWFAEPSNTQTEYRWNINSGPTSSFNTGPSGDYPNGAGNYLYTEANQGTSGAEAVLYGPCFDLAGLSVPGLNFHYHMLGSGIGSLHLDVLFNGTWFNDIIPPLVGNKGDQWHLAPVSLGSFAGSTVSLRFRAKRGTNTSGDIAIDMVKLGEMPQVAMGDTIRGCGSVVIDAGNPGATYQWTNGANTQTIELVGHPFQTVVQTVGVTVTNAHGLSDVDEVVVVIEPGPYVNLGGEILVCGQDSLELDAQNVNATYLWDDGSTSRTRTVTSSGIYHVAVTGNLGCAKNDTVLVAFRENPEASFTYSKGSNPRSIQFSNNSQFGSTYFWDFGNGFTSTAREPGHVFQHLGQMYRVMLVVTNECGSDTTYQAVSTFPLGVDGKEVIGFELYPNPVRDVLFIKLTTREGAASLQILDATGKQMFIEHIESSSILDATIDTSHLAPGVYLVRIIVDGYSWAVKFVKL